MARRPVFRVTYSRRDDEWVVKGGGRSAVDIAGTKAEAVAAAVERARELYAAGTASQVVIHKKDGEIQSERTFGRDPRRSKG